MNSPKYFDFITSEQIKLTMNLYRASKNRKNITILYFHGGGLLYGQRDDLPSVYLNKFLDSGYDFLALDYPLAPESNLNSILKSAYEETTYFIEKYKEVFELKNKEYVFFGRSAGAYLCFMLTNMLINNEKLTPSAIISLYGYARLDEVQFHTQNKYYCKFPSISDESIKKIILDKPITYAPLDLRFSLYVKARQEGKWIGYLCNDEDPKRYSLSETELNKFPPTILSAATLDPDVPFKISKSLSKLIPNSKLITIYDEVHDFDRDIKKDHGVKAYIAILEWLESIIR